jgi:hypothetical protein
VWARWQVVPPSDESNRRCLEVLAKYLDSDHALRTINAEEKNQPRTLLPPHTTIATNRRTRSSTHDTTRHDTTNDTTNDTRISRMGQADGPGDDQARQPGAALVSARYLPPRTILAKRETSPAPAPPGHIIDLFGTTGLQLIGARVFCMRYHCACGMRCVLRVRCVRCVRRMTR